MTRFLTACCALLFVLSGQAADSSTLASTRGAEPAAGGAPVKAAYLKIVGEIAPLQDTYLERAMAEARAAGCQTLVVEIDSPGGRVDVCLAMLDRLLVDDLRLVAFVEDEAISAAAMLSYAHHAIYIKNDALIGNIGAIFQGPNGEIQYAPEKINTYLRGHFRRIVQKRGWPKTLLLKMTDREKAVYEARLEDGRTVFVSERDGEAARFLADHPEVAANKDTRWIERWGEGDLLTLSGAEALTYHMATAAAEDLDAVYAAENIDPAQVLDLQPTATELWARKLQALAPFLIGLAVLFLFLEFKTPGVGIFAVLAGVCGLTFIIFQYSLHLANHLDVVVLTVGILIIVAEIWTGFSGGLMIPVGAAVFLAGLVLAFMANSVQFDFGDSRYWETLGKAAGNAALATAIMVVGLVMLLVALPKLPWIRRLQVQAISSGTSAGKVEAAAPGLAGRRVVVAGELHPGGTVLLDGEERSAFCLDGGYVPRGATVVIAGTQFGDLVVRPATEAPEPPTRSEAQA